MITAETIFALRVTAAIPRDMAEPFTREFVVSPLFLTAAAEEVQRLLEGMMPCWFGV